MAKGETTYAKKKLLNPRGYLSWTQVDMWQRSRARYISKYMLGAGGDITNSGMEFGKRASEALEGSEAGDGAMEALVSLLPHYSAREHEIRAPLRVDGGTVDLLGKLDTFDPKTLRFREYKTGRVAWTQSKAEKHRQIQHYALLVYLSHGSMPASCHLDWVQTEEVGGEVRLTGRIESFEVKVTFADVLQYGAVVTRVAREIDEEYRKQLKNLA